MLWAFLILGLAIVGSILLFRRALKRRTAQLQEPWEPSFETGVFSPMSPTTRVRKRVGPQGPKKVERTRDTEMGGGFVVDTSPAADPVDIFVGGAGEFGGGGASGG